jgi:hypothetical protein
VRPGGSAGELIGHNQTNALRLTEMDAAEERDAVRTTPHRGGVRQAPGRLARRRAGRNLERADYLAEAGIRYVCDWLNDDQPYLFEIGNPSLVSLPYSMQTNDVPAYFEMKVSVPEFESMLRRQFDTLYREGETVPRVMAIAVCHWPAASDRCARCGARTHLLASRSMARHRLGNRAAFPGAAAESGVNSAL